jgi:hypothetical protein
LADVVGVLRATEEALSRSGERERERERERKKERKREREGGSVLSVSRHRRRR